MMMVSRPLVDLRGEPRTTAQPGVHDPLQETQLLYGERVNVLERRDGWAFVEALEQEEFSHNRRWQGYPGWVPESSLAPWREEPLPTIVVTAPWAESWANPYLTVKSDWTFAMGTYLTATEIGGRFWRVDLPKGERAWLELGDAREMWRILRLVPEAKRQLIIEQAEKFIGTPYLWGGRSALGDSDLSVVTGVDCSALVNLAYRVVGMDLPRDAHEQYLRAKSLALPKPGDLVFLSAEHEPKRIVHVMLYAGGDELIEAPGTGQRVRRISVQERLGRPLASLKPGDTMSAQTIWFGSYLP